MRKNGKDDLKLVWHHFCKNPTKNSRHGKTKPEHFHLFPSHVRREAQNQHGSKLLAVQSVQDGITNLDKHRFMKHCL